MHCRRTPLVHHALSAFSSERDGNISTASGYVNATLAGCQTGKSVGENNVQADRERTGGRQTEQRREQRCLGVCQEPTHSGISTTMRQTVQKHAVAFFCTKEQGPVTTRQARVLEIVVSPFSSSTCASSTAGEGGLTGAARTVVSVNEQPGQGNTNPPDDQVIKWARRGEISRTRANRSPCCTPKRLI